MSAPRPGRPWRRRARNAALAVLALVGVFIAYAIADGWRAFGKRAEGERLARMQRSARWGGERFTNPEPLVNDTWGSITGAFDASPHGSPTAPLPVERRTRADYEAPPVTGLRVTWLGHSTLLVEIDGHRVLTDPLWGERTSPLTWVGPARWYEPPLPLAELPPVDAVLISHDHYDHLDFPTIEALRDRDTVFVAPLGVGAHLAYWGVPEERIRELDWWDRTTVGTLEIVCTPARHASGRTGLDTDTTLWAGYALVGPRHRAYFSGDTGLFPDMRRIGAELGPFDVTMIEVGAYGAAWPDWHLGPEQAVRAHGLVRGGLLVPIHWGLVNLAYHGWTEPIERTLVAAETAGVRVATPRPGGRVEPGAPAPVDRWWPETPWRTGEQDPIRASKMD